jgi:hypothetical protein
MSSASNGEWAKGVHDVEPMDTWATRQNGGDGQAVEAMGEIYRPGNCKGETEDKQECESERSGYIQPQASERSSKSGRGR